MALYCFVHYCIVSHSSHLLIQSTTISFNVDYHQNMYICYADQTFIPFSLLTIYNETNVSQCVYKLTNLANHAFYSLVTSTHTHKYRWWQCPNDCAPRSVGATLVVVVVVEAISAVASLRGVIAHFTRQTLNGRPLYGNRTIVISIQFNIIAFCTFINRVMTTRLGHIA